MVKFPSRCISRPFAVYYNKYATVQISCCKIRQMTTFFEYFAQSDLLILRDIMGKSLILKKTLDNEIRL